MPDDKTARIGLAAALVLVSMASSASAYPEESERIYWQFMDAAREGVVEGDWRTQGQEAVTAVLKDPDSARFKGLVHPSPGLVCGWVNSKSSVGGYGGMKPFAVTFPPRGQIATIVIGGHIVYPYINFTGDPQEFLLGNRIMSECIGLE